jgi:hypothetical protein
MNLDDSVAYIKSFIAPLGEKHFGEGRPYANLLGVTLGTGVRSDDGKRCTIFLFS